MVKEMMNECLEEKVASYQRVWAEVDLDAIEDNMRNMKKHIAKETRMIGVIKMDGYGHGSVPIAKMLEVIDFMYGFAVATAEEAHILRAAGINKPVLILGYAFPYCYEMLIKEEIRPAVFRQDEIESLSDAARLVGKKAKVHVKVDTGMGRVGITPDETGIKFIKELMQYENIEIEGIFTHFAKADEEDKTATYQQLSLFLNFVKDIEEQLGLHIPLKHCANSAGILEIPQTHMDIVRAGIAMYGLAPSDEVRMDVISLTPALSWYSRIVFIKTIHEGQSVSYGGTFTATKDTRVATIPVGYGDGYPRSLSNKGYVLIHGKKAPILGRVCMDQFMVDVTDIPEAKEDDKVTLLGCDGEMQISAELLGDMSGRFNYELICDIGKRVPRVYLKAGKVVGTKDYNHDYE